MNTHKPIDEYYLHDHGDGNGSQIMSKGPGKFGLITTGTVHQREGVVEMEMEQLLIGILSSTETTHYMLTPEEAETLGQQLIRVAEEAEGALTFDPATDSV